VPRLRLMLYSTAVNVRVTIHDEFGRIRDKAILALLHFLYPYLSVYTKKDQEVLNHRPYPE
jgi:hypothetical protein